LARERRAFLQALDRNPHDWYTHTRLALLESERGNRKEALAHVRRARSLNPRGGPVELAENAVLAGRPVGRRQLDALDGLVIRSPLGRRPLTCRPVLGVGARCGKGFDEHRPDRAVRR
jgi:hypothetical protein